MKITIELNTEEAMILVLHLGWIGFEMQYLNKFSKGLFCKTAKQIWNQVHSQDDQLKTIESSGSSILKLIYNYKMPGDE